MKTRHVVMEKDGVMLPVTCPMALSVSQLAQPLALVFRPDPARCSPHNQRSFHASPLSSKPSRAAHPRQATLLGHLRPWGSRLHRDG